MDEDKRLRICEQLEEKRQKGDFIHPNPCYAFDDALQEDEIRQAKAAIKKKPQRLSFRDYYAHFHTTVEQPGWRMIKPETGNVYYEHV